jgi:hypothetical protein
VSNGQKWEVARVTLREALEKQPQPRLASSVPCTEGLT